MLKRKHRTNVGKVPVGSRTKLCFVAAYVKRVIAHPSFRNIDYKSCEKEMANMEQGEVLIRPSSKVIMF